MEQIKENKRINIKFTCKKTSNIKKILFKPKKFKNQNNNNKSQNSILFETSTDLSSNNIIRLEEQSPISKIPSLEEIKIPSFFNDIIKYNDINKRIKNYKKIKNAMDPELSNIYLINIKSLYDEAKKI